MKQKLQLSACDQPHGVSLSELPDLPNHPLPNHPLPNHPLPNHQASHCPSAGIPPNGALSGNQSHDFDTQDLVYLFDNTFLKRYQTQLIGGNDEPEYLPRCEVFPVHRILFTRDYFASALHEVAHWCIAGDQRRELPDYGYWYAPDGRSAEQQQKFESVEVKPQAIEWMLSRAADFRFRVSADNLEAERGASASFRQAIWQQVHDYCESGLPLRAQQFANALAQWDFERREWLLRDQWRPFQHKSLYVLDMI